MARLAITENIPGTDGEGYPPLNPVHYEVSAYHVDPTQEKHVRVPAGTIVFSRFVRLDFDNEVGGFPGWQRMDKEPLKRDARETDRSYIPKVWKNVALRVSGCIPSKTPKGRRDHTHDTPAHNHEGGLADGSPPTIRVDRHGNFFGSYNNHTHDIAAVSPSYQQVMMAENLRRHLKLPCFMAVVDGAPLYKGMMMPFVPRLGSDDVLRATGGGLWKLLTHDSAADGDPLLAVTSDVGDFRQYDPDDGKVVKGRNTHSHDYDHHHVVTLSQARNSTRTTIDHEDDDLEVSAKGHNHGAFVMAESMSSTESINPLQYRRLFFIERMVHEGETETKEG